MKKIWVIVIDEVSDYVDYNHKPKAYSKEEDARKEFESLKEEMKSDYKDELKDGWCLDEGRNSCEVYNDGWYAQDHYSIHLYDVEVD